MNNEDEHVIISYEDLKAAGYEGDPTGAYYFMDEVMTYLHGLKLHPAASSIGKMSAAGDKIYLFLSANSANVTLDYAAEKLRRIALGFVQGYMAATELYQERPHAEEKV